MRVSPQAIAHLRLLIDEYVPGCEFVNAHAVVIGRGADLVWAALPDALQAIAPHGVLRLPLWIAAAVRREVPLRRCFAPPGAFSLREGATVGLPGHASRHAVVIDKVAEGREFVAIGRHRYSDYVTNIYLERVGVDQTRVYNVTRANFGRSPFGRFYFFGVRIFHDPIVEWGLRRFRRFVEARATG